jgi:hypothetical protein
MYNTLRQRKSVTILLAILMAAVFGSGIAMMQTSTTRDSMKGGQMMGGRGQMMSDMQAADQKLNDLVAKMNAAKGNDKIEAMTAVINALVAERSEMHAHMSMLMSMMNGEGKSGDHDHPAPDKR